MQKSTFFQRIVKDWGFESLVWIAVLVLLTISNISTDISLSVELAALLTGGMLFLSILNRYLLLPYMLHKRRMWLYLLFSSCLIIGFIYLFSYFEETIVTSYVENLQKEGDWSPLDIQLPSESKPFFDMPLSSASRTSIPTKFKVTVLFFGSFFISTLFHYRNKEKKDERTKALLLQEKTEMELKFLKSQMNPHFLFNALNNIYSMIYMGDKNAANSVLMLSEMLRYVTDESGEEKINLIDEIHYLENYIDFQRFRYERDLNLTFEKNITSENILISPMLFQPFVENSFKYSGVGVENDAFIKINLTADKDSLSFDVVNSKRKKKPQKTPSERSGVGLANVSKRLELLYPDCYTFHVKEEDNLFSISLKIDLRKNNY
ncbi:MAG TPA: histidine kinase [Paludibacteraceae bacterium]|jgi:hypothetical protein|nr:histidine kinase [Paludibacteraceae bacterium]HQF50615.1 histidine kinase [Paludibacteraceae bacterium]